MLFLQENCWVEANDRPSKVGLYSVFIAVLRVFLESINTKWAPQLQGLLLNRSIFCPHPVLTWQQLCPPQQKVLHRMEGVLHSPRHPVFTQWLKKPHVVLVKASSGRDGTGGGGGDGGLNRRWCSQQWMWMLAVENLWHRLSLLFILAPLTPELYFRCVFFFIECCFTSVFWLENQMSHQNTPSACHVLRRSASLCTWADY